MIRPARRLMPWTAGLLVVLTGGTAFGQGNIFNPYGNSGYADYREFGSPKYAIDSSLPGEARLQGGAAMGRGANQFQAYLNSIDGSGTNEFGAARGAPGLPYYRAQQLFNAQSGRNGDTPANRLIQARIAERNAAYQAALAEKDPKKRAIMFQRLDQDAIDRPLSAINNKTATPRRAAQTGAGRAVTDSVARSPETASPVGRSFVTPRSPARTAPAPARPTTPARAATPTSPSATPTPSAATTPPVAPLTTEAPPASSVIDPSSVPIPPPR